MESLRKLGLLDAERQAARRPPDKALNDLLPRFRRRFPAIQDEVEITEVFEEAARRIRRERQSGPIELRGYAWKALESIGVSAQRRSTMQVRFSGWSPGPDLRSCRGFSAGRLGRTDRAGHLLREIEASLTRRRRASSPQGPRLLERGDRQASRQLGELGRQGHEPLEAQISRADGRKGVENTGRAQVVPGITSRRARRAPTPR